MHISTTTLVTLALAGQALSRAADKVCTAASATTLLWRITGFEYRDMKYTMPSSEIAYGLANFTLQNSALSHKTTCTGFSTRQPDYFTGETVYNCSTLPDAPGDLSRFTFDRATGMVKINQTWVCDTDGSRFGGQGHVQLDLKCHAHQQVSHSASGGYEERTNVCDKIDVPVNITYLQGTI